MAPTSSLTQHVHDHVRRRWPSQMGSVDAGTLHTGLHPTQTFPEAFLQDHRCPAMGRRGGGITRHKVAEETTSRQAN